VPSTVTDLAELGSQVCLFANGQRPQIFKGKVDIAKFFNRKGDITNDDQLRAAVGADPAEAVVLTAWAMGESSVATITYGYLLEIEYDVVFMEPKDLAPSAVRAPAALSGDEEYEYVRVKKVAFENAPVKKAP
jgi:hypothetical protein